MVKIRANAEIGTIVKWNYAVMQNRLERAFHVFQSSENSQEMQEESSIGAKFSQGKEGNFQIRIGFGLTSGLVGLKGLTWCCA